MTYGPIDILAIEFPDNTRLLGEGLAELIELVAKGTIRIIDLLVVMKDADGNSRRANCKNSTRRSSPYWIRSSRPSPAW